MNFQYSYQKILSQLKLTKIPNPESEMREILCDVLKKNWTFILVHPEIKLTARQQVKINSVLKKRLKGEPLAYILGYKNFYGLDFKVNKNVLIPRPETELMVEKVLELLRSMLRNKLRRKEGIICLDVGTGSGCIPISIVKNLNKIENRKSKINFLGLDVSLKSLQIAKQNIDKYNLKNKIILRRSNLLENLLSDKLPTRNYQLIIMANLPYLSQKIYSDCSKSVKNYEPKLALEAGQDGLDLYRKLLDQIKTLQANLPFPLHKKESKKFLNNPKNYKLKTTNYSTAAFFEISPEQKTLIEKEILIRFPTAKIKFYKDLSQKWRLVRILIIN